MEVIDAYLDYSVLQTTCKCRQRKSMWTEKLEAVYLAIDYNMEFPSWSAYSGYICERMLNE